MKTFFQLREEIEEGSIKGSGTDRKSMFDLARRTKPDVKPAEAPEHFPKDVTMDLTKMKKWLGQE